LSSCLIYPLITSFHLAIYELSLSPVLAFSHPQKAATQILSNKKQANHPHHASHLNPSRGRFAPHLWPPSTGKITLVLLPDITILISLQQNTRSAADDTLESANAGSISTTASARAWPRSAAKSPNRLIALRDAVVLKARQGLNLAGTSSLLCTIPIPLLCPEGTGADGGAGAGISGLAGGLTGGGSAGGIPAVGGVVGGLGGEGISTPPATITSSGNGVAAGGSDSDNYDSAGTAGGVGGGISGTDGSGVGTSGCGATVSGSTSSDGTGSGAGNSSGY
jgi:hypothetical protein